MHKDEDKTVGGKCNVDLKKRKRRYQDPKLRRMVCGVFSSKVCGLRSKIRWLLHCASQCLALHPEAERLQDMDWGDPSILSSPQTHSPETSNPLMRRSSIPYQRTCYQWLTSKEVQRPLKPISAFQILGLEEEVFEVRPAMSHWA